jgi:hypothetical protein
MDALAIVGPKAAEGRAAQSQRLVQYRLEYGSEIAGRSVNHSQHLGGCCLLFQCLVMLGFALGKFSLTLGKLALQIGYDLLGIGYVLSRRRAHILLTSRRDRPPRTDHTGDRHGPP